MSITVDLVPFALALFFGALAFCIAAFTVLAWRLCFPRKDEE